MDYKEIAEIVNCDFKKLKKYQLIQLLDSIYEITNKELLHKQKENSFFEIVFESDHITIPDMDIVRAHVAEKWGEEFSKVTPTYQFKTGDRKKVIVVKTKTLYCSQHVFDHIKSSNGRSGNVFGLSVAELTLKEQLPKNVCIRSIDQRDMLSVNENGDRIIAGYFLNTNREIRYFLNHYIQEWVRGSHFLYFCD